MLDEFGVQGYLLPTSDDRYGLSLPDSDNITEGLAMYGRGEGPIPVVGGAVLLPNTGGNTILTVVAVAAIVIGSAIMLSTIARTVAKKVL